MCERKLLFGHLAELCSQHVVLLDEPGAFASSANIINVCRCDRQDVGFLGIRGLLLDPEEQVFIQKTCYAALSLKMLVQAQLPGKRRVV